MSFIHYKLITNQNYEKVTFDGVSLSVSDLKKLVLDKKFRKQGGSGSQGSSSTGGPSNRKLFDVDLEVTNVDTNEVYQRDSDMIPKNSRVQINRVVKNIGPAIAGGVITKTHMESEQLEDLRVKQQQFQEKQLKNIRQIKETNDLMDQIIHPQSLVDDGASKSSSFSDSDLKEEKPQSPGASIYSDFINMNDENSSEELLLASLLESESDGKQADISMMETRDQELPPEELLCPFEDHEKNERHLIINAIIVPCCGYFICCEECIRERLSRNIVIECPKEECLQEITSNHHLTPYNPMRQKVQEYMSTQSKFCLTVLTKFSAMAFRKKNTKSVLSVEQKDDKQSLKVEEIEPVKTDSIMHSSNIPAITSPINTQFPPRTHLPPPNNMNFMPGNIGPGSMGAFHPQHSNQFQMNFSQTNNFTTNITSAYRVNNRLNKPPYMHQQHSNMYRNQNPSIMYQIPPTPSSLPVILPPVHHLPPPPVIPQMNVPTHQIQPQQLLNQNEFQSNVIPDKEEVSLKETPEILNEEVKEPEKEKEENGTKEKSRSRSRSESVSSISNSRSRSESVSSNASRSSSTRSGSSGSSKSSQSSVSRSSRSSRSSGSRVSRVSSEKSEKIASQEKKDETVNTNKVRSRSHSHSPVSSRSTSSSNKERTESEQKDADLKSPSKDTSITDKINNGANSNQSTTVNIYQQQQQQQTQQLTVETNGFNQSGSTSAHLVNTTTSSQTNRNYSQTNVQVPPPSALVPGAAAGPYNFSPQGFNPHRMPNQVQSNGFYQYQQGNVYDPNFVINQPPPGVPPPMAMMQSVGPPDMYMNQRFNANQMLQHPGHPSFHHPPPQHHPHQARYQMGPPHQGPMNGYQPPYGLQNNFQHNMPWNNQIPPQNIPPPHLQGPNLTNMPPPSHLIHHNNPHLLPMHLNMDRGMPIQQQQMNGYYQMNKNDMSAKSGMRSRSGSRSKGHNRNKRSNYSRSVSSSSSRSSSGGRGSRRRHHSRNRRRSRRHRTRSRSNSRTNRSRERERDKNKDRHTRNRDDRNKRPRSRSRSKSKSKSYHSTSKQIKTDTPVSNKPSANQNQTVNAEQPTTLVKEEVKINAVPIQQPQPQQPPQPVQSGQPEIKSSSNSSVTKPKSDSTRGDHSKSSSSNTYSSSSKGHKRDRSSDRSRNRSQERTRNRSRERSRSRNRGNNYSRSHGTRERSSDRNRSSRNDRNKPNDSVKNDNKTNEKDIPVSKESTSQHKSESKNQNDQINDENLKKEKTYHKLSNLLYKKSRPSSATSENSASVAIPSPKASNESLTIYKQSDDDKKNTSKNILPDTNGKQPADSNENNSNKKRIVFLLKGNNNNGTNNNTTVNTDSKEEPKTNTTKNPVALSLPNQITLSPSKTTNNSSAAATPTSSPKKSKRRVYLKQELTSPSVQIKSIPIITSKKEEQPKKEDPNHKPQLLNDTNNNNGNSMNLNHSVSLNEEDDFLDISINEKDNLNSLI